MSQVLTGIDGRNPCGFFAALGMLRTLVDHPEVEDVGLAWTRGGSGMFHPVLVMSQEPSRAEIAKLVLESHIGRDLDAELGWAADVMKLDCDEVRALLISALGGVNRRAAETIGACVVSAPRRQRRKPHPDRFVAYTPLRVIPRVGRARFLSTALSVSRSVVSESQVHAALFGPWEYVKANSLRWDPGARVPLRAYSAEAPTNFGPLGVPGAIALAVAGLCFFSLTFADDGAFCSGFDDRRARIMQWPIWSPPLDEAAVRVILGLPAIHASELDIRLLSRYGIIARVSAKREPLGNDGQMLAWGEVDIAEANVARA